MRNISLVRIDDRLIHGQVITAWIKVYPINKILIIDDELSGNRLMSRIYKAAAPIGVEVILKNRSDSLVFLLEPAIKGENILILVKTPERIEELIDGGITINKVILGGMGARDDRQKFNRNVSANEEEVNSLKRIISKGVEIFYQLVPLETPVDIKTII